MRIAVFYHCWWRRDAARDILREQMETLKQCGLEDAASEIHLGFQGSDEGFLEVSEHLLPGKASIHRLPEELGEIPTLQLIHNWIRDHADWNVCYFHGKGASHANLTHRWRHCMERAILWRWQECVEALKTVDSAGAHWMRNAHGQWFWGGNFWWCSGRYLSQLPAPGTYSRWDAEIWVSNVTKMPSVKDLMADHVLGQCQ